MLDAARALQLFREQQAGGFPDVAGAHVSATIPVSDRLVTRLLLESLPENAPIRELELTAFHGNRFSARVRLSRPAFLPTITVNLAFEEQPHLPDRPVFVLRLLSSGLLSFAAPIVRFLDALPPGIDMHGDVLTVNVRTVLEQRGLGEYLSYLEHLELTTDERRFILSVAARAGSAPADRGSAA